MRKFIVLLLGVCILGACDEKKIPLFEGRNEIFFEKFFMDAIYPGTEAADSTVTSFFFYPDGTKDIEAPLTILCSGIPLTEDVKFQLKVVESGTTALPEEYTIDPEYIFHAEGTIDSVKNDIRDVIKIKIHHSQRLEDIDGASLLLEIVPNENVAWGQIERIRAKIFITTTAAQPVWWDAEVTNNLLGRYSQTKYKLFLNEVDRQAEMNAELIKEHPDQAIKLVLEFKSWLMKQVPLLEDEYGLITVAL